MYASASYTSPPSRKTAPPAASPYDVSAYGIAAVPIETEAGRAEYKRRQIALMKRAEPVRAALLAAYDVMLEARPAEGAARGAAA